MKKKYPYFLYNIDITNQCNLRCPTCPNAHSTESDHPHGNMSIELFSQILDKIERESPGQATYLCLFNWGDPFMHPQLPQFVELARKRGMPAQISTNLNLEKNIEEVVRAEPLNIRISLSALDQTNYYKTHYPGDVSKVMSNARFLRACLDKYASQIPVHFYYHKYRHNQGETLQRAQKFAESLGFEFKTIKAGFAPLEKMLDIFEGNSTKQDEAVLSMLCFSLEEARERSLLLRGEHPDCVLRQYQTTIDFDGGVANCCIAYERKHYLHPNFLDLEHADLQTKKYNSELCRRCRAHAVDIICSTFFL
ncbi:radical SAM protein [bacterium]|nr:radical SAM protein [bacterium]